MNDTEDAPTQYFVRKLTRELATDLVGDAPERDDAETGWDRFLAGASQIGVAIKEVVGGALFGTKPKPARQYRSGGGGTVTRNLYGYFLLVEKNGKVEICRDPDTYTFPRSANVYIVADLVGMPIARLTGKARQSSMSVVSSLGQRTDAEYIIDLWLDPGDGEHRDLTQDAAERLGRFLSQVLAGRDSLTIDELVRAVDSRLQPFFDAMLDVPTPGRAWVMGQRLPDESTLLADAINAFQQKASEYLGLTVSVRFRPGARLYRHATFLSEETRQVAQRYASKNWEAFSDTDEWTCPVPGCGAPNEKNLLFCGGCGGARPSATAEARADRTWKLVTRDGQDLNLEVEYFSYNVEAVDEDGITTACIDVLWKECRRLSVDDLEDPAVITRLNNAINNSLTTGRYGMVGEFSVVYFDTAESEWKRQVRAKLREQLRSIDENVTQLDVTDGSLALREMQLLRDHRDIDVMRQELASTLDRARVESMSELAYEQLQALTQVERDKLMIQTELQKRRTASQAAVEEMRFTREASHEERGYARADALQADSEQRSDELVDVDHQQLIENKQLDHGLVRDDKILAAKRQAEQEAAELQARIERMKAGVKFDGAKQAQELDLEKQRSEQDLASATARMKTQLEIDKLKAMGEIEAMQREQQGKMSAAQLMALQASSLAEKGALDALTKLAGHDGVSAEATAEARVAKMQAEMLERMMAMQAQAQQSQLLMQMQAQQSQTDTSKEAMAQQMQLMMMAMQQQQATSATALNANQEAIKAAMSGQHAANARIQDAQQQTADAAVAWNDRSISAMANVAATKAGNPANPAAAAGVGTGSAGAKFCPSCGSGSAGAMKFCAECGTKLFT
jgi:hypothetical protein